MKLKKPVLSLFSFILVLFLANIAVGQEDFIASTLPSVDLCPCSNQGYPVTIQNIGSVESSYTLNALGNTTGWISFNPKSFALKPGQSGNFFVFVNSICNLKGEFELETVITASNGLAKSIKQNLKINECYGYELQEGNIVHKAEESISFAQHDGQYSLCTNEQASIPILITNNDFDNEYRLFLGAPEWAKLNLGKAKLESKKSGIALITFDTNNVLGKFDLELGAISELGKVQKKKSLKVNVGECYNLEVSLEKEEDVICSGEKTEYNVITSNSGTLQQNVELKPSGAEWAAFGNNSESFELADGKEKISALELSPKADISGKAIITVSATPDNKPEYSVSDSISLNVVDKLTCYEAGISAKSAVKNIYNEDFFFVKATNNGIKKAAYGVSLEGPSWVSVNPKKLELNPGQVGNINVKLNPGDDIAPGAYGVRIILDANEAVYSKNIDIKLRNETELEKKAKSAIKAYKYHIYLLIAIIILALIFLKPIIKTKNRIKDSYKRYKVKKEKLRALRLAREQRKKEAEKKKQEEEKRKEKAMKKESQRIARKENPFFKKHKPWIYSIMTLVTLAILGSYLKFYSLRDTYIYFKNLFVMYLYYILMGFGAVIALFLLVLLYNYIRKKKKNAKKIKKAEKEEAAAEESRKTEKASSKQKRWYNNPTAVSITAFAAIALTTASTYLNYFEKIKDFIVLYSYYFALGLVILIIILGALSFYGPVLKFFKE